jgi:hypothetical protein
VKNQNDAVVTSIGFSLEWHKGEPSPIGLVAWVSDGKNRAGNLIPWHVLPGRTRAQILHLIKYAGFDMEPRKEVEGQLLLDLS